MASALHSFGIFIMTRQAAIPALRIFAVVMARAFYVNCSLGVTLAEWNARVM
ncbi:MAG: hypothetical protein JWM03_772 [Rhodocyclales bacterium]|nr:hypothetical protein [Rhodocyclales bacterium]MDB5887900.1 hypothetical protein [Rhodocyclales bacterium]